VLIKLCCIILIYTIFSVGASAQVGPSQSQSDSHKNIFLGEHDYNEYYGPLNPAGRFNHKSKKWEFADELFLKEFFKPFLDSKSMALSNWWLQTTYKQFTCSNLDLAAVNSYSRYLYRLISMSYLYEGLKKLHLRAYQLGLPGRSCQLTKEDLIKNCNPSTMDMKKFVLRGGELLRKKVDYSDFKKFRAGQVAKWSNNFTRVLTSQKKKTIVQERIYQKCLAEKLDCSKMNIVKLRPLITRTCQADKKMVYRLCSEEDTHYGVSELDFFHEILAQSNVIQNINQDGQGVSCLRRFVQEFSFRESYPEYFHPYFSRIRDTLLRRGGRYLEGELFVAGALKEFDDKGLADFLFTTATPVAKVIPKPVGAKTKQVKVAKALPKVIVKEAPKIVVKRKKAPQIKTKPRPKQSVFETAVTKLNLKKLLVIGLNMNAFRNEFKFTDEMVKSFSEPLKLYSSRKGLADMKKLDGLGQRSEPMTLFFLKYLLDKQAHQSLWNIVSIIGQKFYVVNDIERRTKPIYVSIKNDSSTKGKWQLLILKSPSIQRGDVL